MVNPGDNAPAPEQIVLPPLVEDGVEHACREALAPHVPVYLDELAEARQRDEETAKTKPPFPDVGDDAEAYLGTLHMWRERNPSQERAAEAAWATRIGTEPTNNLHLLFARARAGALMINSDIIRSYMERLATEDAPFVNACRTAAKVRSAGDAYKALVAKERELTPEEQVQGVLDTWICDLYMTEAFRRFRSWGATDDELKALKN